MKYNIQTHGNIRIPVALSPRHHRSSPPPSPSQRVALVLAQRATLRVIAVLILLCTAIRFHAAYRSAFSTSSHCFHPYFGDGNSARCLPSINGALATNTPSQGSFLRDKYPPRVVFLNPFNDTISVQWRAQPMRPVTDMGHPKARQRIAKRDDLELDTVEDETCRLRHEWQKRSHPTCNSVHEFDGTSPWSRPAKTSDGGRHKLYRMIGYGFWRDVWIVQQQLSREKTIFKTMRWNHDYTPRNFDRMRRDAVAMERLTASPFVIDIYAFCGTSSLSEYGNGGDIPDAIWPRRENQAALSQIEKLRIATQAAIGLATVHNIDREGEASIAHTDIAPAQYINVDGIYKLNDFNRARFLAYKVSSTNKVCPFSIGNNPGKNRSPEEYAYEPQTEKADVYSLGNIFYMLLQGEWPFEDIPSDQAMALVQNGTRPTIYLDLWHSDDPVNMALKEVMMLCHVHDPLQRGTARQVQEILMQKMRELDPGRLESWGLS